MSPANEEKRCSENNDESSADRKRQKLDSDENDGIPSTGTAPVVATAAARKPADESLDVFGDDDDGNDGNDASGSKGDYVVEGDVVVDDDDIGLQFVPYNGIDGMDGGDEAFVDEMDMTNRKILREGKSQVVLNSGIYNFHMQSFEFLGHPNVQEISTKIYFEASDSTLKKSSEKTPSEQAKASGQLKDDSSDKEDDNGESEIGYLTAFLLPRPVPDSSSSIYDVADSVSDELNELTTIFCNRQGHATRIDTGLVGKDVEEGGFLQIYSMEIMGPDHCGKCDLGLRLVHETLVFLQNEWNLAVMVPCLLGVQVQRWSNFHNRLNIDPSATEHTTEQKEGLKQAHINIKRHFSRMGFVQAGRNSDQHHAWYLTSKKYFGHLDNGKEVDSNDAIKRWKSKDESKMLDVFVAPDKHEPKGVDAELHSVVLGEPIDLEMVKRLVKEKGASVHESRALFVAAADNDMSLLRTLVDDIAGDVNKTDENGNTPLHVASMMMNVEAIDYLIEKGASRDIRNDKKHNPLQTLEESIENMDKGGDDGDDATGRDTESQQALRCRDILQRR